VGTGGNAWDVSESLSGGSPRRVVDVFQGRVSDIGRVGEVRSFISLLKVFLKYFLLFFCLITHFRGFLHVLLNLLLSLVHLKVASMHVLLVCCYLQTRLLVRMLSCLVVTGGCL